MNYINKYIEYLRIHKKNLQDYEYNEFCITVDIKE